MTHSRLLILGCLTLLAACGAAPADMPADSSLRAQSNGHQCPSCGILPVGGSGAIVWVRPEPVEALETGFISLSPSPAVRLGAVIDRQGGLVQVRMPGGDEEVAVGVEAALACSLALDLPRPATLPAGPWIAGGLAQHVWSGRHISLTQPVPASAVATPEQADGLCTANFGADWHALGLTDVADALPPGVTPADLWGAGTGETGNPQSAQ